MFISFFQLKAFFVLILGSTVKGDTLNLSYGFAMRGIGSGHANATTFNSVMNIPPPLNMHAFVRYQDIVLSAAKEVANKSMKDAVEETCEITGSRDFIDSFDGTWHKKGYVSLNGVMTACSVVTGKVTDVAIYSKFCKCPQKKNNVHTDKCTANYQGTSGGMEVEGASAIFKRSVEKYNVR